MRTRSSILFGLLVVSVVAPSRAADAKGDQVLLLADSSFEKTQGWRKSDGRVGPATIVTEDGNRHLQITVSRGRGEDVFAPAKVPAGATAVKIRFRARCQINENPDRPAVIFMIGKREKSEGKPVKLAVSSDWRDYGIVVRFRARPDNDQFKIVTVASPISIDIDDLQFLPATEEESRPSTPLEGPERR